MAMSGTMSNQSDWLQFYNQSLPDQHVSEATAVTAVAASAGMASQLGSGNPSSSTNSLSPEGRVSKPVRKRSRASRRTPTTLLNTDTANFRAMVQQFTGGPSTTSFPAGPSNFSFGLGPRQGFVNPTRSVMVPPGYNPLQQQLLQQQQQQQQQQQPPFQQYLLSLNNNYPQTMSSASSAARVVGPTSMGMLSDGHDHQEFLREGGGGGGSSGSQVGGAAAGGGGGSGRPNSNPSNENRMSSSFLF